MSSKVLEKQTIFAGKTLTLEVHRLVNNETGKRFAREVVVHPGAVVVLALLDDGRVLMIRNYRYAVGETLLELPAGTLEKGEPPINAAGRELLEECGYLAGKITPLGSFFTSPGILGEKMHAFVATKLVKKVQALEEGEEIEVAPMKVEEAIEMAGSGAIHDGKSIATLLMFAARRSAHKL